MKKKTKRIIKGIIVGAGVALATGVAVGVTRGLVKAAPRIKLLGKLGWRYGKSMAKKYKQGGGKAPFAFTAIGSTIHTVAKPIGRTIVKGAKTGAVVELTKYGKRIVGTGVVVGGVDALIDVKSYTRSSGPVRGYSRKSKVIKHMKTK